MPTSRFEQRALAQILLGGCAVAFSACILAEHAQAQPGYVPPPTPLPPPVLNPSNPGTVPQPSYRPVTPSTPGISPTIPSTVPSVEATPPANEEPASTTARSEQPSVHSVHHHHRGRFAGYTWPYYCGSSPCVRIHPRAFYSYAAPAYGYAAPAYAVVAPVPVYAASTLWRPGYYDYAPGQFGRGHPRYGGYGRRAGYHGD
jgi:hypothetical protein